MLAIYEFKMRQLENGFVSEYDMLMFQWADYNAKLTSIFGNTIDKPHLDGYQHNENLIADYRHLAVRVPSRLVRIAVLE